MASNYLSPKQVCKKTSLSRTTLDRLVADFEFPQPIRLTKCRLAYKEADVEDWLEAKEADLAARRAA